MIYQVEHRMLGGFFFFSEAKTKRKNILLLHEDAIKILPIILQSFFPWKKKKKKWNAAIKKIDV